MKKLIIFLFMLTIPTLFAQELSSISLHSASIFKNYRFPYFEAKRLVLGTGNLFDYMYSKHNRNLSITPEGNFWFYSVDSLNEFNTSINSSNSYAERNVIINGDDNLSINRYSYSNLAFSYRRYLDKFDGVFVGTNDNLLLSFRSNKEPNYASYIDDSKQLNVSANIGYGRVLNTTNVLKALVIEKELNISLSDEQVQKLAQILSKSNYYYGKYKEDWQIEFYKAIAEITNKPELSKKIEQIIDNIYPISERLNGWDISAGYSRLFLLQPEYRNEPKGFIYVQGNYALPIGIDKQFYAFAKYSKGFGQSDNSYSYLQLYTKFSYDYNFSFSSSLNAEYTKFYGDLFDKDNFNIGLVNKYYVSQKLTTSLKASFTIFQNYPQITYYAQNGRSSINHSDYDSISDSYYYGPSKNGTFRLTFAISYNIF